MPQKRILVAVEDHGMAQDIIAFLCAHTWPDDAQFMLLYVVAPDVAMQDAMHGLKQHEYGEALLHEFAQSIRKSTNREIHMRLVEGRTVEQVLEQVSDWSADLLVIGSHGKSTVARWFLGSSSLALLTQVSCPIAIIRPPRANGRYNPLAVSVPQDVDLKTMDGAAGARKIMLAVEDYKQSEALIDQTTHHRWLPDTRFKVAYVNDTSKLHDTGFGAEENAFDRANSYGTELVRFVAEKIREAAPGGSVEEVVLQGTPVQVLLAEAAQWQADLLILGSHGRSAAERWCFGSVSLPVLSQANCAVMIVRPAKASMANEPECTSEPVTPA